MVVVERPVRNGDRGRHGERRVVVDRTALVGRCSGHELEHRARLIRVRERQRSRCQSHLARGGVALDRRDREQFARGRSTDHRDATSRAGGGGAAGQDLLGIELEGAVQRQLDVLTGTGGLLDSLGPHDRASVSRAFGDPPAVRAGQLGVVLLLDAGPVVGAPVTIERSDDTERRLPRHAQ